MCQVPPSADRCVCQANAVAGDDESCRVRHGHMQRDVTSGVNGERLAGRQLAQIELSEHLTGRAVAFQCSILFL